MGVLYVTIATLDTKNWAGKGARMKNTPPEASRHHILFPKSAWRSNGTARSLRQIGSLIPLLDNEVHSELHRDIPLAPLLGINTLYHVMYNLDIRGKHPLDAVDRLILAIEETKNSPKAKPLENDLADLTVRSLVEQRPYIQQGIIAKSKPHTTRR